MRLTPFAGYPATMFLTRQTALLCLLMLASPASLAQQRKVIFDFDAFVVNAGLWRPEFPFFVMPPRSDEIAPELADVRQQTTRLMAEGPDAFAPVVEDLSKELEASGGRKAALAALRLGFLLQSQAYARLDQALEAYEAALADSHGKPDLAAPVVPAPPDHADALNAFTWVFHNTPQFPLQDAALLLAAFILADRGQVEGALALLNRLFTSASPASPWLERGRLLLGAIHLERGQLQLARTVLTQVDPLGPSGAVALFGVAESFFLEGKNHKALASLMQLLRQTEQGPPARDILEIRKLCARYLGALFQSDDWNADGRQDEPAWADSVLAWTADHPWAGETALEVWGAGLQADSTLQSLADCQVAFEQLELRYPGSHRAPEYAEARTRCAERREGLLAQGEAPLGNSRIHALRRSILWTLPSIRGCYAVALRSANPPVKGTLTVRMDMAPGVPVEAVVAKTTMPEALGLCTLRRLQETPWPLPVNGTWQVHIPFVFEAE